MKQISIKNKILINSIITVLFAILMVYVGFIGFNESRYYAKKISPLSRKIADLAKFKVYFELFEGNIEKHFAIGGEMYRAIVSDDVKNLSTTIETLKNYDDEIHLLADIEEVCLILKGHVTLLLSDKFEIKSNRKKNETILLLYSGITQFYNLHNELTKTSINQLEDFVQAQQDSIRETIWAFIALGLIVVVLYSYLGLNLYHRISQPLEKLKNAVSEMTSGNLDIQAEVKTKDEIGDLAKSFNDMAKQIKKSMNEVMESEKKFRLLSENANDMIYRMSLPDGIYQYVSPAAEKIFGYSPQEFYDSEMLIQTIIHPDWVDYFEEEWAKLLKGDMPPYYEYQIIHKSGEIRWLFQRNVQILDDSRQPVFIEGIVSDITEHKQDEEKLQKWAQIFQYAEWGVVVGGPEGVTMDLMNPAYAKMHGYTVDELTGQQIINVFAPEYRADLPKQIQKTHDKGHHSFESIHIRKDGTTFPVLCDATAVKDESGNVLYRIVNILDITDRKRLEDQLQKSQKMESIGTLAGGIAHDFNNILSPIIGMSEMLMEDLSENSSEQLYAKEIFKAGQRATSLVRQILTFSRQSENKIIPLQIRSILKEALKLCRSTIPSDIEILKDIQLDCGLVKADPTQIHQISMNLITNAYHAVEENSGKITVHLKEIELHLSDLPSNFLKPGRYVCLTVSDTGCGIHPSIMDKIFDPYFTTKEQGKGTGLGLATVFGIVRDYRGDITVDTDLGKGTTFNVYLPIMEKIDETEINLKSERLQSGTERILLVDDEESIVKLQKINLERLGYHVISFTSSAEALKSFNFDPNAYDLVITDMTMPEMTGVMLSKELKTIKPDIPILICTGFSERIEKEEMDVVGVDEVLMKPIVRSVLSKKIRELLDNKVI